MTADFPPQIGVSSGPTSDYPHPQRGGDPNDRRHRGSRAFLPSIPPEARAAIWRPTGASRVIVWLPRWMRHGEAWLKARLGARTRPKWNAELQAWEVGRPHLPRLTEAVGAVLSGRPFALIMDFSTTQKCDRRCVEAQGWDCECSCNGRHHAGGRLVQSEGWFRVGTTTLVSPSWSRSVELLYDDGH